MIETQATPRALTTPILLLSTWLYTTLDGCRLIYLQRLRLSEESLSTIISPIARRVVGSLGVIL